MKAVLTARAELWTLMAVAEVAFWEPRPEFHHLCRAAEAGRALDAETLVALVPGLSPAGARNLGAHLVYIGLADGEGGLTRLGKSCATTGLAPTWEFGAYEFLIARHPLFGSTYLDIQRLTANPQDYDFKSLAEAPVPLPEGRDRMFTSVRDASQRFSVYGVEAEEGRPTCRCAQLDDAKLIVTVRDPMTGLSEWRLEGAAAAGPFKSTPEPLPPALFAGLMGRLDRRWNPIEKRLAMPFDGYIDPYGRNQFMRDCAYANVPVTLSDADGAAIFDRAEVSEVPVGPHSAEAAAEWAIAVASTRLAQSDSYVSDTKWDELWREEIAASPLAPRLDRAMTLADALDFPGADMPLRTRWLLSAATDLAME
jgi:hypothetical protein